MCINDSSRAEALRAHYGSVFTHASLTSVLDIPQSPNDNIPVVRDIQRQLESIRPDNSCFKETASELALFLA